LDCRNQGGFSGLPGSILLPLPLISTKTNPNLLGDPKIQIQVL
jgi:hypothetical protein